MNLLGNKEGLNSDYKLLSTRCLWFLLVLQHLLPYNSLVLSKLILILCLISDSKLYRYSAIEISHSKYFYLMLIIEQDFPRRKDRYVR